MYYWAKTMGYIKEYMTACIHVLLSVIYYRENFWPGKNTLPSYVNLIAWHA